jgi:hypothetical protein
LIPGVGVQVRHFDARCVECGVGGECGDSRASLGLRPCFCNFNIAICWFGLLFRVDFMCNDQGHDIHDPRSNLMECLRLSAEESTLQINVYLSD